jgi:hypothetical protein
MPIFLATWEVEIGDSWSETSPGQKRETLSENSSNKLNQKGLRARLK